MKSKNRNSKIENPNSPIENYKLTELGELPESWEVVFSKDLLALNDSGIWGENYSTLDEAIEVLRSTNIQENNWVLKDIAKRKIKLEQFKRYRLIEGDILFVKSSGSKEHIGKCAYVTKEIEYRKCIFSNFMQRLRFNSKVFPKYCFYYFSEFGKKELLSASTTTTGLRNLKKGDFENILIPLPPLPEQKKIAYVLSTAQEAQEKTEKYIQALKELKKSTMKHLFTYGVNRVGELGVDELKDTEIGKIPKEWKVVRLEEVFDIYAGGDVTKLNFYPVKTEKFKYPIFSNSKEKNGLYGFSDTYKFPENSITITGRGHLGYAVPRFEKFNAIIRLLVLVPRFEIKIKFIAEFINENIKINFEGSSIPQLTKPKISKYSIPLPPLPVQERIASILSTIDEAIEAAEKKKKALKELFNSLLKNLMTARIRVGRVGS